MSLISYYNATSKNYIIKHYTIELVSYLWKLKMTKSIIAFINKYLGCENINIISSIVLII